MYTSDSCSYCHRYKPIFDKFPRGIRGCHFAIANTSQDNQAIQKICQGTNIALSSVPHFVLFSDGVPIAETSDRHTLRDTAQWIKTNLSDYMASEPQPPSQSHQRPPNHPQSPPSYGVQNDYSSQQPPPQRRPPRGRGRGRDPRGPQYSDTTGVRIFKTSYGIPANAVSGEEFERYEAAYENRE